MHMMRAMESYGPGGECEGQGAAGKARTATIWQTAAQEWAWWPVICCWHEVRAMSNERFLLGIYPWEARSYGFFFEKASALASAWLCLSARYAHICHLAESLALIGINSIVLTGTLRIALCFARMPIILPVLCV